MLGWKNTTEDCGITPPAQSIATHREPEHQTCLADSAVADQEDLEQVVTAVCAGAAGGGRLVSLPSTRAAERQAQQNTASTAAASGGTHNSVAASFCSHFVAAIGSPGCPGRPSAQRYWLPHAPAAPSQLAVLVKGKAFSVPFPLRRAPAPASPPRPPVRPARRRMRP